MDGTGEAGSTPGFSYTITSAEGSVLCWDTNVSSATSPTAAQTGSGSDSVGALLAASGGGGGTTTTTAPTTTTSSSTTTTRATTTTTGATTTTTAPTTTTTTAGGGTISTVGSLAYASGSATTVSVSPKAIGDLMTLVVSVVGGPVSSVSGGGVTNWYKDIAKVGNQEGNDNEIWRGVVSATGASTITVAFTGSHSDDELMAQEYSAGAGATWSAGANGSTSSTTSTVTFPSLTPSGPGQLYVGFAQVDGTGEAGSTPGFSYTITSAEGSVLCWDTNVSSATSPTAAQTGSGSDSVGALLAASGGGGGTTTTGVTTTTTAPTTTTTTASGSAPVTTYMIELTGGVLLEVTGSTQAWYYPNLQGGTAAEASSAGTAVGGVTLYDPFGNTLSSLQADSPDNLAYGYEGKHGIGTETDGANTVMLMGARLYNPATGRFLQVDPVPGGSANAYDYVGQDPLNASDLYGDNVWNGSPGKTARAVCHGIEIWGMYCNLYRFKDFAPSEPEEPAQVGGYSEPKGRPEIAGPPTAIPDERAGGPAPSTPQAQVPKEEGGDPGMGSMGDIPDAAPSESFEWSETLEYSADGGYFIIRGLWGFITTVAEDDP